MDHNSTGVRKDSEFRNYAVDGKVMLCSVVALLAVVFFLLFFQCYIRWLVSRIRNRPSLPLHHHRTHRPINPTTARATVSRRGLDPLVLKSLPTFIYAAAAYPKGLECAVCLSEFEDNESGRVLPDCNHCFHIHCIDMWFRAHSNCPLCRAPVARGLGRNTARNPGEIVVSVAREQQSAVIGSGSASDPGFRGLDNDGGHGLTLLPLECRRKSLELTDFTPEMGGGRLEGQRMGRDIEEEGIGSSGDSGSKSNRVASLKRFLSL